MAFVKVSRTRTGKDAITVRPLNETSLAFVFGGETLKKLGWVKGTAIDVLTGEGKDEGTVRIEANEEGDRRISTTNMVTLPLRAFPQFTAESKALLPLFTLDKNGVTVNLAPVPTKARKAA